MKVKPPVTGFSGKIKSYTKTLVKVVGVLISLYLFICSLTFLSVSFRILGGRNLSQLFSSSKLLSNPIVGVMIGILVTVLVQSSATSTSIIVSLVSAGVNVKHAIPMILGSNVGTSVTNTIVSMTQAADREIFRRAFAAATVHDMFNWLSVIVLMSLELLTGFLETLTHHIVESIPLGNRTTGSGGPDLLKPLTKPFTSSIVQIDKKILLGWSMEDPNYVNVTSILRKDCGGEGACTYALALMGSEGLGFNDIILGIILLSFALSLLIGCLLILMKILNSMLGSSMAIFIQKVINAEVPYVPWLTGYLAMLIGAVITILVRSSSVFTSTLTPLCGTGLVTLETAYPMTLGSNIGTTTTSILASFAAEGKYLKPSIQISFVHLFFNIVGILIFYPIPFMRWPIPLAQKLGDITSQYRWFAGAYLLFMFVLLPLFVFGLSVIGPWALYSILGPTFIIFVLIIILNIFQSHKSNWLPYCIRNWEFLPLWMHSLDPLDRCISQIPCHRLGCCNKCFYFNDNQDEPVRCSESNRDELQILIVGKDSQPSILKSNGISQIEKNSREEEVSIIANTNINSMNF